MNGRKELIGRRHSETWMYTKMSSELKWSNNRKMVQFVLFVFHVVNLALYISRIAELPVQYSSRPTTAWRLEPHYLAYDQIY